MGRTSFLFTFLLILSTLNQLFAQEIREIGFHETPGHAISVTVENNHAFVSNGRSGLRIIDISDPENPEEIGNIEQDLDIQSVAVVENFAYVAARRTFHVFDISDPGNPSEVDAIDSPGTAVDVANHIRFVKDAA